MAIQTIKATIQMRYGLEADLKPDQLVTGEWAVATDKKNMDVLSPRAGPPHGNL